MGLRLPAAGLYAIVSRWVPVARDPDGMAMEEGAAAKIAASGSYLRKFKLYETSSNFYMVGSDKSKTLWRVLKIDRLEATELNIHEDSTTYSQRECYDLLKRIDEGNRLTGGLKFVTKCYGIVGFIRFLGPYYMLLITERRQIGVICGHRVFAVTKSDVITLPNPSVQSNMVNSRSENRYKRLLGTVDLTKDFFFSYSYHIMCSLQKNLTDCESGPVLYDTMFVWNEYLTRGIRNYLKSTLWTVALVYGYFGQVKLSLSGKDFTLTLIARRSRHYAGPRYMKRGINENGRVANDVETEQIVFEDRPGGIPSQITSVVQNRGSIPLFWSQETSRLNIKPDIILHKKDRNYEATRLHFENLVKRYGSPIIILNLIKTREKKPRESILRTEFVNAIDIINEDLPEEDQLKFLHWDFHSFSRRHSKNVLLLLANVSSHAMDLTGFFNCQVIPSVSLEGDLKWPVLETENVNDWTYENHHDINNAEIVDVTENVSEDGNLTNSDSSGLESSDDKNEIRLVAPPAFQKGVLRTNCIDCLDRTNVAQYSYGLAALGRQLHALSFIDVPKVDPDSALNEELMIIYEKMGDTLALQYGGSAAHNKIFCERRGQWKAATRSQEFFRTLQRYYNNAYLDGEKQDAMNLFLGHFQPEHDKPALWELGSDQHYNVGRSFMKRSLSDGNILHESIMPESSSNAGLKKHPNSAMSQRAHQIGDSKGFSESTPEITCDKNVSYSRYTPVVPPRELFAQSEHSYFSEHMFDSSTRSNFLDLDWLSTAGNSCEEEIYDRSTQLSSPTDNLSTENVTNNMANVTSSPPIESGSNMKGKERAEMRPTQASDVLNRFPESFVQWVNAGDSWSFSSK